MTLLSAVAPVLETPFDAYLAKQSEKTAVDRFSRHHESTSETNHANDFEHGQARYYRDLIPMARPEPGQQYGFEVDLDSCTGCKACVAACHSLNGLDDDESWRTVTLLRSEPKAVPYQQSVTSACHHCVDPACLKGCPVDAYEKDPITGIVSHLDDQCIGCSYCTLACPYEVPVYNPARGIVRKCDMCSSRLSVGEAPACVQGCPNAAISIKVIDIASATKAARVKGSVVVAGAPPSTITVPTTVYRSAKELLGNAMSTEHFALEERPADRHTPLAVMLVLTQLSVGAFAVDQLSRLLPGRGLAGASHSFDAVLAVATGLIAMGASVFHLGRPRYFYRAIIGLRHSWLSREVLAFGSFTGAATLYALAAALDERALFGQTLPNSSLSALGAFVAVCGIAGVGCSVMIYATTNRASWHVLRLVPKFAATTALCGLAAVIWASVVSSFFGFGGTTDLSLTAAPRPWLIALVVLTGAKLVAETLVFRQLIGRHDPRNSNNDRARVARLLSHHLKGLAIGRFIAGLVGGIFLPLLLLTLGSRPAGWIVLIVATLALATVTVGELLERSTFFATVSRPS